MKRLDVLLFEKNLFPTREKAKEAIESGIVNVNDKTVSKPGQKFDDNIQIVLTEQPLKYVSRAGLKLEKAADIWNINFKDKIVMDVGASTGGFTDYALQNGAKLVYAIDVGTNQLHDKIKSNPKVVNMEKTDFRSITSLPYFPDIAVCDCSFISLKLLSQSFEKLLKKNAELIVLIKPQFECGLVLAKKYKGVITDSKIQQDILKDVTTYISQHNFKLIGTADSPILGTKGNKEFLAYFVKE